MQKKSLFPLVKHVPDFPQTLPIVNSPFPTNNPQDFLQNFNPQKSYIQDFRFNVFMVGVQRISNMNVKRPIQVGRVVVPSYTIQLLVCTVTNFLSVVNHCYRAQLKLISIYALCMCPATYIAVAIPVAREFCTTGNSDFGDVNFDTGRGYFEVESQGLHFSQFKIQ